MTPTFDDKLVDRATPWAACAALEEFFAKGGQCRVSDPIHWAGVEYSCSNKASNPLPPIPDAHIALAWAWMAIAVKESLNESLPKPLKQSYNFSIGAMWVRVSMIERFGHIPGDSICDLDKLLHQCLNLEAVIEALELKETPHIFDIGVDARCAEQIVAYLVEQKVIACEGNTARLIDLIARAKAKSMSKLS